MASFRLPWEGLLPLLAAQLRAEGNNLVKATLVKAVGRFQESAMLGLLSGFLSDPDARVRANTVEALGFYQTPEVVPLLNPLIQDEASRVRGNALLVLGRFHQEKILQLVNQMAVSPELAHRETAVFVLSRLGGAYGAQRLLALYVREPHPPLRQGILLCLRALEKQGVPEAVAGLAQLAGDAAQGGGGPPVPGGDPPGAAPAPAPAPADPVAPPPAPEDPEKAWPQEAPPPESPVRYPEDLRSEVSRRRLEAVQLAPESGAEVFLALRELLQRETDEFVIATLVKKLGRVGGEEAFDQLLPFSRNPDGRIRANALEGLEATGSRQVIEVARGLLEDEHPRVRAQAARILAGADQDQGKAVSVLKEMLLEGDEQGALSAVHALERIDASVILEIMELALVEPKPSVRNRVLQALRIMGESNALAARLAERYAGASTFEDDQEVNKLLSRMNSRDEAVRYEALRHLSLVRSEKAQSRIELATSDASEKVRNLARVLVEDFGRAYKRQGVLHSLGIAAVEALRGGIIQLERGQEELESLDQVARELGQSDAGAEEAPRLLARRRELLVGLGERIYRELPGCQEASIHTLLSHLRDLEQVPVSGPPSMPGGGPDLEMSDQAIQDTLRELAMGTKKPAAGSPASRKEPMAPPPPSMAEQALNLGKDAQGSKALMAIAFMAVVGALGYWVTSTISSGLATISKPWAMPVDARCEVRNDGQLGFAGTSQGVLGFALPTGSLKWRLGVENHMPDLLQVGSGHLICFSRSGKIQGVSPETGKAVWESSLKGTLLSGTVLEGDRLLVPLRLEDEKHALVCLDGSTGGENWRMEISTGAPSSLSLRDEQVVLVSGSTLFGLGASDGQEKFSYDHAEDFLRRGPVARTSSGGVLLCSLSRVLTLSSSGNLSKEGDQLGTGRPMAHPLTLAQDRHLLVVGSQARLLDDGMNVLQELELPFPPRVHRVFPGGIFLSDKSPRVLRLLLQDETLVPRGVVQATETVHSLSVVEGHVVVGTRSGIEMMPRESFDEKSS